MKYLKLTAAAWVVVFIVGCAADPTARWAQQRIALTTAQDVMVTANQTGQFSDADLVKASPYVVAARNALAKAETYLPNGGPAFDILLDFVVNVSTNLQALDTTKLPELTNGPSNDHGTGSSGAPNH